MKSKKSILELSQMLLRRKSYGDYFLSSEKLTMNIGGDVTGGNANREYVEADQWRKATSAEAVDRMDSKLTDDIEHQDNSSADSIVKATEADKTTVNKSEESESQQSGSKETGVKVEKTDTEEAAGALDEYGYTKRDSFTSELFKIHITNMHKKFGFKVSYFLFEILQYT